MSKNFIGVLSILLLLCCGRCNFLDLSTFVKPILDPHAYKADRNNLFQEFKIFDQRRNHNLRA
jgi:ABC-type enterochelin transport system permease subunit